jgi:hypothetical protein
MSENTIDLKSGRRKKLILYSLGQIALIVVGILIASYAEEWNKKRNEESEFRSILEQIYNANFMDCERLKFNKKLIIQYKLNEIDRLLTNPDSLPASVLMIALFNSESDLPVSQLETKNLLPFLNYHTEDSRDREVITQVTEYATNSFWNFLIQQNKFKEITELLGKANIPKPNVIIDGIDISIWDKDDHALARRIVHSKELRSKLITAKSRWQDTIMAIDFLWGESKSLQDIIKAYYPQVRLTFDNMGIIGSALPSGWERSVPMKLVNSEKSIWEIDLALTDGEVKFRNQNSWKQNWGGNVFPKGELEFEGENIPVKSGNYHIIINLLDSKCEFVRKNN